MKRLSHQIGAFLLSSIIVFSSCQKANDVKKSPVVDPANKASLKAALNQPNMSAKEPGQSWWTDETSADSRAAGSRPITSFTYLEAALELTGLDDVLSDPATIYTLFAPSDLAFQNAGFATVDDLLAVGSEGLTPILLNHVVGGAKVFAADVTDGPATTLNETQIFLTSTGDNETLKVFVNGFGVYIPNQETENGVVHCINQVLFPPSLNLVETAIATPDLSYLVAAVVTASTGSTDVAGVLSGDGPFTLFAPTNQAFINAGFETIEEIEATDPDALAAILTYHVINGARVFACDIPSAGLSPTMLSGGVTDITTDINRDNNVSRRDIFIKGLSNTTASLVVGKNINATNGVAHIIDQVLLP
jgi:uncharacterized surface protein with fasciclin (FAS1) repeats